MGDFLPKLKKIVRIVLYGPAISQSDCRKAGLYQLPCNMLIIRIKMFTSQASLVIGITVLELKCVCLWGSWQ